MSIWRDVDYIENEARRWETQEKHKKQGESLRCEWECMDEEDIIARHLEECRHRCPPPPFVFKGE